MDKINGISFIQTESTFLPVLESFIKQCENVVYEWCIINGKRSLTMNFSCESKVSRIIFKTNLRNSTEHLIHVKAEFGTLIRTLILDFSTATVSNRRGHLILTNIGVEYLDFNEAMVSETEKTPTSSGDPEYKLASWDSYENKTIQFRNELNNYLNANQYNYQHGLPLKPKLDGFDLRNKFLNNPMCRNLYLSMFNARTQGEFSIALETIITTALIYGYEEGKK